MTAASARFGAAGAARRVRRDPPAKGTAALALCVVAGANVGCAARAPATTEPVPRAGTSHIQDFQPPPSTDPERRPPLILPPSALSRALPEYPASALDDAVSCVARILYHVETSGRATLVRLEWVEPPPAEHVAAFEDAVRTSVSRWRFESAVRVVPEKLADGSIEPRRTPVPTAQHAFISFRVEDGRAVVE